MMHFVRPREFGRVFHVALILLCLACALGGDQGLQDNARSGGVDALVAALQQVERLDHRASASASRDNEAKPSRHSMDAAALPSSAGQRDFLAAGHLQQELPARGRSGTVAHEKSQPRFVSGGGALSAALTAHAAGAMTVGGTSASNGQGSSVSAAGAANAQTTVGASGAAGATVHGAVRSLGALSRFFSVIEFERERRPLRLVTAAEAAFADSAAASSGAAAGAEGGHVNANRAAAAGGAALGVEARVRGASASGAAAGADVGGGAGVLVFSGDEPCTARDQRKAVTALLLAILLPPAAYLYYGYIVLGCVQIALYILCLTPLCFACGWFWRPAPKRALQRSLADSFQPAIDHVASQSRWLILLLALAALIFAVLLAWQITLVVRVATSDFLPANGCPPTPI